MREMQARMRFVSVAGNFLRTSRVSSARNVAENTICFGRGQFFAELMRVESAKYRRKYDLFRSRVTLCEYRACRVREV